MMWAEMWSVARCLADQDMKLQILTQTQEIVLEAVASAHQRAS
jgi:hypothetical protein